MPAGNQHKAHGLTAQLVLRVSPVLKAKLITAAREGSAPGSPITPSDIARSILELYFAEAQSREG